MKEEEGKELQNSGLLLTNSLSAEGVFHQVGGDWAEMKDWLPFHDTSSITGKLCKSENTSNE